MALKVGELFASFNLDTSGVGGAVSAAEKEMASLGKNLAIGGAAMTAAVTVPLKQAATSIYNAGSGFDAQMSKVFAIIGEEATGSAEVMEALRHEALEMGSTTAFTASEAGEAMQYMAMAGWKVNDMLAGLSPIMDLAAASGESLGTVSDIVTDALTAFGLTAEDTAHFTDVLAAASSNSNTNVAIMGESFKYAAPLAGSLGYSVDDVAVALGLMANAGIKGSMAGTSLRQVLSNLISPTDAQASAMEALGLSLYDSNGKVKSLAELMVDMRKAASESGFDMQALTEQVAALDEQLSAGTITQEDYDAQIQELTAGNDEFLKAISDLAGARGLSGMLAIMNATEADFLKLTAAVNGSTGAAKTMAQVMLDNAQGDVTLFKSALEGLEITLWGLAEDGFRNTVKSATSMIDSFRNADEATLAGTLRLSALAAAAGPVMAGLGGIITILPKLAATFTAVSGPGALLAIGMIALGAAAIDSGNSMGKTFVKGATKAGNKVRQLGKDVKKQLPTLTKNMGEFLNSISTGIEQGLPGIMEGITEILTTGISAIAGNMGNIANVAQTIVRTLADGIVNNMPEMVSSGLELLTELAASLITNIPVVQEGIARVMTSVIEEVNNAKWSEIGTKLNSALQESLGATGTWFRQLAMGDQYTEEATWADVGFALANNVLEGIRKAFGNTKDFIGSLLLGGSYDPNEDWSTFGGKIIDKVFEGVDGAISGATDFVGGILDGLASVFTEENISAASDTLSSIVSRIITAAVNEIPNLVEHAGTILTKIGELIFGKEGEKGLAGSALEGAGNLAGAIINAIVSALPDVEQAGESILNTLAGILSASNIQSFMEGATSLATNLLTAITTAIGGLGGMASNLLSAIGDALFGTNEEGERSLVASAIEGAGALAGSLIQAIADSIPGVETAAESIITAIAGILSPSNIKDIGEATKTLAGNILTGIANGIRALGASAASILTAISDAIFGTDENEDSAVTAGVAALTGIVQTIFDTVTNDVIPSMGDAVGGILTAIAGFFKKENLAKLGTSLGSLGESIIRGIADAIGAAVDAVVSIVDGAELDTVMDGIGASLGNIAEKLVSGLTYAIPKLVDAGGKLLGAFAGLFSPENLSRWVSGAGDLAKSIIGSIVTALSGDANGNGKADLSGSFAGLAQGIASGIVTAVEHLPELLDNVLSVGAQIANSIMGSITSALADTAKSGVGTELATAATNLVHGLLTSITNFGENEDVQGFIRKLGEGLRDSLYLIGEFTADLVMNLFSAETLKKVWEAGKGIIGLLLRGIGVAIEGIGGLLDGIVSSILDRLGVIDKDKIREEVNIGAALSEALTSSVTDSEGKIVHSAETAFATIMAACAAGENEAFEALIEGTELENLYSRLNEYFFENSDLWSGYTGDKNMLQRAFEEAFAESGIDITPILDKLPDNFWEIAYESITGNANFGAGKPLLELLWNAILGGTATTNQPNEDDAFVQALKDYGFVVKENAEQTESDIEESAASIIDAADKSMNDFAKSGMTTTMRENMGEVEESAAEVSDAAVKQFLLTMSAENGRTIAQQFIGGIVAILEDGTLVTASDEMAKNAYHAVEGILTKNSGSGIGQNLAQGLAEGIYAGADQAIAAAQWLASQIESSIRYSLDIHSPSGVAKRMGMYFAEGFAQGLEQGVSRVEKSMDRLTDAVTPKLDANGKPVSREIIVQVNLDGKAMAETLAPMMDTALGDLSWNM